MYTSSRNVFVLLFWAIAFQVALGQTGVVPEQAKLRLEWRKALMKVHLPGKGAFEATFPSKVWREVKYKTVPKRYPMLPKHGPRPLIVGNGNDVSAQVPSGHIVQASGEFDSVTSVTSESGLVNNTGSAVANAYSLQLNTNFFASTVAGSPPGCRAWEQFVLQNDGGTSTTSVAFIQYWLINYGTTSPPGSGWIQFGSDWYRNSTSFSIVPTQAISNLKNLVLGGTTQATNDSYQFNDGNTAYSATGDNSVNAAAGWNTAEFCVVGDGGGGQANFNPGSSIITRTEVTYGGTDAPNCVAQGFTAETNNLSFGPT
ncbi:MAG: hypothetical protein QOJ65_2741, partial [Fimbriimonadaceae bacterium]|nr:hypothetical protein [Fimbriimonadaceae bacterium]